MERRDDADRVVAHVLQRVLHGDLAVAEDLRGLRRDAAAGQRLAERRRLRAAGDENEDGVRIGVLGALHEGGEIRIRHRHPHRSHRLAARRLEPADEAGLGIDARPVVGDHRVDGLDALFRRPVAEHLVDLRDRHRGACHVGRLRGDDRGGGIHHHHEFLRLGRDVGRRDRVRRQGEAGQEVDVVAHHQLLRQALGDLGGDAADILADDLDLLAGDGVAVLLHVELDAVVELDAGIGELAGERQDHADLDRRLRPGPGRADE